MPEIIAVIDVGTNSVKLLVARTDADRLEILDEALQITRLGSGVRSGSRLPDKGVADTLAALKTFRARAVELGATQAFAAATQVLRLASDAEDFVKRVKNETKMRLSILSGQEEGEASFLAATSDAAGKEHLVVDVGGGSTELVYGVNGRVQWARSLPLGALTLTQRFLKSDPPEIAQVDRLQTHMDRLLSILDEQPPSRRAGILLVGGTSATVGSILGGHPAPSPERVHAQEIRLRDLRALHQKLLRLPVESRKRIPGIDPERADILAAGVQVLLAVLDRCNHPRARISSRGLRYGLALQHLKGLR